MQCSVFYANNPEHHNIQFQVCSARQCCCLGAHGLQCACNILYIHWCTAVCAAQCELMYGNGFGLCSDTVLYICTAVCAAQCELMCGNGFVLLSHHLTVSPLLSQRLIYIHTDSQNSIFCHIYCCCGC